MALPHPLPRALSAAFVAAPGRSHQNTGLANHSATCPNRWFAGVRERHASTPNSGGPLRSAPSIARPSSPRGRRFVPQVRRTTAWIGVLVALSLAPPVAARASKLCETTAAKFEKAKRFRPVDGARLLARVHEKDPTCVAAPQAAYHLMLKLWGNLMPDATRAVGERKAEREWARFKSNAAFVQAIVEFRYAPDRPKAAVSLGRLYEGMSTYLDQVGTGPDSLVVIREVPESLYHTRAVDLSEHLKIQAESSYELAVRVLTDASSENETLKEATDRLQALRERYRTRSEEEKEAARRAAARAAEKAAAGLGPSPMEAPLPVPR